MGRKEGKQEIKGGNFSDSDVLIPPWRYFNMFTWDEYQAVDALTDSWMQCAPYFIPRWAGCSSTYSLVVLLADIHHCEPPINYNLATPPQKKHLKKMKYWKLKNCKKKGSFLRFGIFVCFPGWVFIWFGFLLFGFFLFLWVLVSWLGWVFCCCFRRQSDQWSKKKLGENTLKEVAVEKTELSVRSSISRRHIPFHSCMRRKTYSKTFSEGSWLELPRGLNKKVTFKWRKTSHVFALGGRVYIVHRLHYCSNQGFTSVFPCF